MTLHRALLLGHRCLEELLAVHRRLHGGALLGWLGRTLVFLPGTAMPVLFVTGLAAGLLRRRNGRRLAIPQGRPA